MLLIMWWNWVYTRRSSASFGVIIWNNDDVWDSYIECCHFIIIFKHVHSQEQRANRIRIRRVSVSIQDSIQLRQNGSAKSSPPSRLSKKTEGNIPSGGESLDVSSGVLAEALEARRSRNRSPRRLVLKMFLWWAFWFAAAFIFCYGTNFVGKSSKFWNFPLLSNYFWLANSDWLICNSSNLHYCGKESSNYSIWCTSLGLHYSSSTWFL